MIKNLISLFFCSVALLLGIPENSFSQNSIWEDDLLESEVSAAVLSIHEDTGLSIEEKADRLRTLPEKGVPQLCEFLLSHEERGTKKGLVEILAELGGGEAIACLSRFLSETLYDGTMHGYIAETFGKLQDPRAEEALLELLRRSYDPLNPDSYELQLCAAEALAYCGGPEAVKEARDYLLLVSDWYKVVDPGVEDSHEFCYHAALWAHSEDDEIFNMINPTPDNISLPGTVETILRSIGKALTRNSYTQEKLKVIGDRVILMTEHTDEYYYAQLCVDFYVEHEEITSVAGLQRLINLEQAIRKGQDDKSAAAYPDSEERNEELQNKLKKLISKRMEE